MSGIGLNSHPHGEIERIVWEVLGAPALRDELGGGARLDEDLGLSSLQVLEAVSALGERLRPGEAGCLAATDVRTVADLCRLFVGRPSAPGSSGMGAESPPLEDELLSGLNRAEARRRRRSAGR